nr:putative ribonuclease H-like domain-containing protein [Tanacetum cinerariifolium]
MPLKPDLVYPSLDDFVDVNESVSETVVEKPTVESNEPKIVRKENRAPIIKDWVSESEEDDGPKFQTVKPNSTKIEFVKPKTNRLIVRDKKVNTARPKAVLNAVQENHVNAVKALACWVWRPKHKVLNHVSKNNGASTSFKRFDYGNPHQDLKDKRVIDSGCSMHMTGNRSYLIDYKEIDGGFVAFGDFKLTDESHVLLKVPRKDNMYNVDLKNVVPQGGLNCLFAKATSDESNLWHRRLGHKGKQHRASCKTKTASSISQPLQMLHMDLFGPTFVKSLMKKMYCLVVIDDFSRFSWVFFLATKDETSEILQTFITCIENLIDLRVKVIRCDNETEFKNMVMNKFCEIKGIKREFSVARTLQQDGVAERKNNRGCTKHALSFMRPFGYPVIILNTIDQLGSRPNWLFDIDALTKSINYKPVVAGNQSNGSAGTKACDNVGEEEKKDAEDPENEDSEVPSIVIRNKARLMAQGHIQEEGIDYDKVFAPLSRIEAIRLFIAYASFKDFVVYHMDVNSAFLYGKIEEEVYVCQPPGFEEPDFPDRVYKVEKALYGLHQAPRAWYETLLTYLLENGFQRGMIDKTLFIKRDKSDILLVEVYVDDIIFGSTRKEMCTEFEKMMHKKFQMSFMGELTFFLGLQVKQKEDGIFISQDKYVNEILNKFGFSNVKTASTPIETHKTLLKDEKGEEVDENLYRSMIGSLMYLNSSRHDIMFASGSGLLQRLNINGEAQIHAKVDGKKVIIFEASIRRDLRFGDEGGIDCFSNEVIFEQLTLIGYEKLT